MKKTIPVFFIMFFIVSLTGCNSAKNNRDNSNNTPNKKEAITKNESGFKCFSNIVSDYYEHKASDYYGNIVCNELENIMYSGNNFFITKDGSLYHLSSKKFLSNKLNCKKIGNTNKFVKIIANTLIDENNNLYSFSYEGELELIPKILEKQSDYGIDQMNIALYKKYNNMFLISKESSITDYPMYGIIKNNKIYYLDYNHDTKKVKEILVSYFNPNEIINKVLNGIVITNNGYYKYDITNKEECNKYQDVICKKGFVKINISDSCLNKLVYLSDDYVIFYESEKSVFSYFNLY